MHRLKVKLIITGKQMFLVNAEILGINDLCLFVIGDKRKKYIIACPDDLLGAQITDVYKLVASNEQIGLKYVKNKLQIHGSDNFYLTDMTPRDLKKIVKNGGECEIDAIEICPHYGGTHIGRDCSCKSGFILVPKLNNNKVIFLWD